MERKHARYMVLFIKKYIVKYINNKEKVIIMIDLHIHTKYSDCTDDEIEILENAQKWDLK